MKKHSLLAFLSLAAMAVAACTFGPAPTSSAGGTSSELPTTEPTISSSETTSEELTTVETTSEEESTQVQSSEEATTVESSEESSSLEESSEEQSSLEESSEEQSSEEESSLEESSEEQSSEEESSEESSVEEHVCEHVCDICGKCTDSNCEDPACADKCQGYPHTLFSDDFRGATPMFGDHATYTDSVATLTDDHSFPLPIKDPGNDYEISFDLDRATTGDPFYFHLEGYNAGDNIYFAIQNDGYTCVNVWKDGVWHYLYGFQNELGGFSKINNITWGTFHNYKILLIDGSIELLVDNQKCLATSLGNFGGYVNPFETGKPAQTVTLTEGTLTGLYFDTNVEATVRMKNFSIKQAPLGRDTFSITTADYPLKDGYSIADLARMPNFKMEGVITLPGNCINGANKNYQFNLRGFNKQNVQGEFGNNGLNVQLGFDYNGNNYAEPKVYPCLFWQNNNAQGWGSKVAEPFNYGGLTELKVTFISYNNIIRMYLNDTLVIDQTLEQLGLTRNVVTGLGTLNYAEGAAFKSLTMTKLTSLCEHVCPVCGKCVDTACPCTDKCAGGQHTILEERFDKQYNVFGTANEDGASAPLAGERFVNFPTRSPSNNYHISFDMLRNNDNNHWANIRLLGLRAANPDGDIYLAFQGDGFTGISLWKDGSNLTMYGNNGNAGAIRDISGIWNEGVYRHIDIHVVDGIIEVDIDSQRYVAVSLDNIAGWSHSSISSEEGIMTGLYFDIKAESQARFKNLVVKETLPGREEITVNRNGDGSTYPLREGFNAEDLAAIGKSFEVESTWTIADGFTADNKNIQMCLRGFNKNTLGSQQEDVNTAVNVQLNFNVDNGQGGFSNTAAWPVLYSQYYNQGSQWNGKVGSSFDFGEAKTLKVKLVSYDDTLKMYINDSLVLDTTATEAGFQKGQVVGFAICETGGISFNSLTMKKYTPAA